MRVIHLVSAVLLLSGAWSSVLRAQLTGSTGDDQPHSNLQPSRGVNYIIRTEENAPFDDLGEIRLFAGDYAPLGWEFAQGQLVTLSQHTALFSKLGFQYGGNGTSNFALPDLRDRLAMHRGTGMGLTPRDIGSVVGAASSSLNIAQMPAHSHTLPVTPGPTSMTGGGNPMPIMQPTQAINYVAVTLGNPIGMSQPAEPFQGQIKMTGGFLPPSYGEQADGQVLPILGNEALHDVIGNRYGGDGTTTFGLPDLRGRVPIHEGSGPGLTDRALGQAVGAESITLSEAQLSEHAHTAPPPDNITGSTGGGASYANMQPSLTLNYIIATQGIFPPRDPPGSGTSDTYLGEITLFAGATPPPGWSFCDGQVLSISSNIPLFQLVQFNFGGNGTSNFALPDLRGRAVKGVGPFTGIGLIEGAEAITLSTTQLPSHSHAVPEPAAIFTAGAIAAAGASMRRARHRCGKSASVA